MKSSRERWAQLGGLPGGEAGGPGRPEAEGTRFGGGNWACPWGSIKSTKPVCRKLQPTIYNYKLPNTMTLRTTKTTDFRMQRLQTCQPTCLQKFSSQPGGPQGAGGFDD